MPNADQILGPYGALILAVAILGIAAKVIQALWQDHLRADTDDRAERDRAMALAASAVDGTKRMAAAWEERNRRDAAKQRSGDR